MIWAVSPPAWFSHGHTLKYVCPELTLSADKNLHVHWILWTGRKTAGPACSKSFARQTERDFQNQNPPLRTSTSSQLQMHDCFGFPQYLSCDDIESKRFAIFRDAVRKHWRSVRDDETRKAKGKFEEQRRQAKRGNCLKRVSIRTYWNLDQTFNRME